MPEEQTVTARAANGHRMVYRVIPPTFPGGEPRLSQWDAECAPDCPACADGEQLPDW